MFCDNLFELESIINNAFNESRNTSNIQKNDTIKNSVKSVLRLLNKGYIKVVDYYDGKWKTNQWIKKAILLSFYLHSKNIITGGPNSTNWWDKIPLKFQNWTSKDFESVDLRVVPNAIVRYSSYIESGVILMPSFINVGAYIGKGSMIDTWSTIGSCARIGSNVHISGGVGIGGVLEPLQDNPTIIEDNCFIGARSEIVEGCLIREGSVLGMGVFIGKSTKIVDRSTGDIFYKEVPPYSVVVPGSYPCEKNINQKITPNLYCAVIIKKVDEKTRKKTSINDLLRY